MNHLGAALALDGVLDRPKENRRQAAQQAVSALFEEARLPLVRYLVHLGVPQGHVEEAVQAAFLKLFEHLLAGGPETNLRGWLFRVARNNALNECKRERRFVSSELRARENESGLTDPSVGDSDFPDGAVPDHRRSPDQLVLDRERNQKLRAALSRISPMQRECLHLRALGLKYREIAEVVRIPTSTVADYLQRALAQLEEECDG